PYVGFQIVGKVDDRPVEKEEVDVYAGVIRDEDVPSTEDDVDVRKLVQGNDRFALPHVSVDAAMPHIGVSANTEHRVVTAKQAGQDVLLFLAEGIERLGPFPPGRGIDHKPSAVQKAFEVSQCASVIGRQRGLFLENQAVSW